MKYGYMRVSTKEQNLARQEDAFSKLELDKVFAEKISGKNRNRPQLEEMLGCLKEGDTVYVAELSRLGRSTIDLCSIVDEIRQKGATFVSLKESIDLSSPSGELIFHILASIAEFERQTIVERINEGIKVAREEGRVGGNKAKYLKDPALRKETIEKYERGEMNRQDVLKVFKDADSFYYYLKRYRAGKM